MARVFPTGDVQDRARQLRNVICRLDSPVLMAEVASHLRARARRIESVTLDGK